jgi:hypothetical protein
MRTSEKLAPGGKPGREHNDMFAERDEYTSKRSESNAKFNDAGDAHPATSEDTGGEDTAVVADRCDPASAIAFLRIFLGDNEPWSLVAIKEGELTKGSTFVPGPKRDAAVTSWLKYLNEDEGWDIYFGINPTWEPLQKKRPQRTTSPLQCVFGLMLIRARGRTLPPSGS